MPRGKEIDEELRSSSSRGVEDLDLTLQLPDDCLGLVFAKLGHSDRNNCSLVCHGWYRVESQARQQLLLLANADLLEYLPLLLGRFTHLTKLALKCHKEYLSIDDGGLFLIGKYAKQLERLNLIGCWQVTDRGLEEFAVVCTRLRKLSCRSCGFGISGLNALLENCKLLEDLSVKNLNSMLEPNEFVSRGHRKLKRLCLENVSMFSHVFEPLIAGSYNLQTLVLSTVSGDWDMLMGAVTRQLPSLVKLRIDNIEITDKGLQAVARSKSLQTLYVLRCPECTNLGVSAVANGCRSLRKLHLDGCFAHRLGDEGLKAVGERCPDLQELVLIRIRFTVDSIRTLGANCSSLERLAVSNSASFGDRELFYVVFECRALKKVCFKSCPISDNGLGFLARGCPNLIKVKINNCRRVTAAGTTQLLDMRSLLAPTSNNLMVVLDSLPLPPTSLQQQIAERLNRRDQALAALLQHLPVPGPVS